MSTLQFVYSYPCPDSTERPFGPSREWPVKSLYAWHPDDSSPAVCSMSYRLFGTDPVVPCVDFAHVLNEWRAVCGGLLTTGGDFNSGGEVDPFFVAYSPNNNIDAASASWRYFI